MMKWNRRLKIKNFRSKVCICGASTNLTRAESRVEMGPKMSGWASARLAFAGTFCLPYLLNLKGNGLALSNSWFGTFAWAALWRMTDRAAKGSENRNGREKIASALLGGAFSLCLAFGAALERAENVDFSDGMMWLAAAVWAVIFSLWICKGWELLAESKEIPGSFFVPERAAERWESLSVRKRAVILFCFLLLCWLPVFLAVYPGFFVYDAQDEFIQVQTRNFTTHHPLPHVLLLGGILSAANKLFGSYNAGIAVYTLFQMCLMAGVFTIVISYMRKHGIRLWMRAATAAYFGFFPVIVMFTLCSAKDGIFAGALLLLLLSLDEMGREREKFFTGWQKPLFFCFSAWVMMCFRHNGTYAFAALVPLLLFFMKRCRKKLVICLSGIFAAYFLTSAGLVFVLSAEDSENQEMLTVPIQQLARVHQYDKESLSEEEQEILYEILPEEVLSRYVPKVSDGVKIGFRNDAFAADPAKYGNLWLKTGVRHPFTYLNAWFMTSYGFWYPDTVIDVYRGNSVFTFTYEDSSFFGYEVEQPGTRESKIPWLNEWYRRMSLEIAQQKIPLISMLFSPGFLFWIFAFLAGYAFYRRDYGRLLPFAMIFLLWLTVILGPTYLPRYVLILWFALPWAVTFL